MEEAALVWLSVHIKEERARQFLLLLLLFSTTYPYTTSHMMTLIMADFLSGALPCYNPFIPLQR